MLCEIGRTSSQGSILEYWEHQKFLIVFFTSNFHNCANYNILNVIKENIKIIFSVIRKKFYAKPLR